MSKTIIEELLTEKQIVELLNDEEMKRAYEQFLKDSEHQECEEMIDHKKIVKQNG